MVPCLWVKEFKAVAPKRTEERSALLSRDVTIMSPAEKAQQPVIGFQCEGAGNSPNCCGARSVQ